MTLTKHRGCGFSMDQPYPWIQGNFVNSIMADLELIFLQFKDKFNKYVQTMWRSRKVEDMMLWSPGKGFGIFAWGCKSMLLIVVNPLNSDLHYFVFVILFSYICSEDTFVTLTSWMFVYTNVCILKDELLGFHINYNKLFHDNMFSEQRLTTLYHCTVPHMLTSMDWQY